MEGARFFFLQWSLGDSSMFFVCYVVAQSSCFSAEAARRPYEFVKVDVECTQLRKELQNYVTEHGKKHAAKSGLRVKLTSL